MPGNTSKVELHTSFIECDIVVTELNSVYSNLFQVFRRLTCHGIALLIPSGVGQISTFINEPASQALFKLYLRISNGEIKRGWSLY